MIPKKEHELMITLLEKSVYVVLEDKVVLIGTPYHMILKQLVLHI